jgi:hypothetical protein
MNKSKKMTQSEAGKLGGLASIESSKRLAKERRVVYYIHPKRCDFCESILEFERKGNTYCSHSCKAYHINNSKPSPDRTCTFCSEPTKNKKYCSTKCGGDHKKQITRERIESTGIAGASDHNGRVRAKEYLIEKNGHKCEMCEHTEWLGAPIALVSDHIDGDHTNNRIDNFRLLCHNCDATLPTYKNRNSGNGRSGRLKRNVKVTLCECGTSIDHSAVKCSPCYRIELKSKSNKPSAKTLIELLSKHTWVEVARQFEVSDNTIRKWVASYGLPKDRKLLKEML